MKHLAVSLCIGMLVTASAGAIEFVGTAERPLQELTLWYRRPAEQWVEALPVGNGRLGGMVYGRIVDERIQLNEGTLWSGGPYDPANPDALPALREARQLIFSGKYKEAEQVLNAKAMARPPRQMAFQPLGDLLLDFPAVDVVENYRRELDLDDAVVRVSYRADGVNYQREIFSSVTDQVIVVHLTASDAEKSVFTVRLATGQRADVTAPSEKELLLDGKNSELRGVPGGLRFQGRVRVILDGGSAVVAGTSLTVRRARSATLLFAAATSYRSYKDVSADPGRAVSEALDRAASKSYAELLSAHQAEHRKLFRRVRLNLGRTDFADLPTDERVRRAGQGDDPQLASLYFQYARYLLMSCSRAGGQPANLQGLWNDAMLPPWDSKYTININTEMNYWPAEPANLPECVEPLVKMVEDLSESGARTAKVMYGARGWVAHHNTDLWRATGPIDSASYGMWPMGGAWLCLPLWEHYQFNPDASFLRRIYPLMKGASEFFVDTLVEEPSHHWLVTNPSMSPENVHPFGTRICAGPAMDSQIVRDLFTHTLRAAEILNLDPELRVTLAALLPRLAPNQIGEHGQLQEWLEDWDAKAPQQRHRHVSHLYALFPSDQITPRSTPEFAAAARKTLEIRGDLSTGWATAWRINLWARLHDGDRADRILNMLLSRSRTYPNLFDAHPPFQIDGNFGGANAIAEMLLQSHAGEIELLPALPAEWKSGAVQGLRARGGFEVDIIWSAGKLVSATVHPTQSGVVRLRYGSRQKSADVVAGRDLVWKGE